MGTSLSSPSDDSIVGGTKSDSTSSFSSSVCDSRSAQFESPSHFSRVNQTQRSGNNRVSSLRSKQQTSLIEGCSNRPHNFLVNGWAFTKSVVVGVLPKFLNGGGGGAAHQHQIQLFGKARTMTSLSDETVLSKNTQSSGYASARTNSSGGSSHSRSSTPLGLLNEEDLAAAANDEFVDANHNEIAGYHRKQQQFETSPWYSRAKLISSSISSNRRSCIPQLKLRRTSIDGGAIGVDERNASRKSVLGSTRSGSSHRSSHNQRHSSLLLPLCQSNSLTGAGGCRIPLTLLQNGHLRQRSGIWNAGYATPSAISATNVLASSNTTTAAISRMAKLAKFHPASCPHPQQQQNLLVSEPSLKCPLATPRGNKTMIQASTSELLNALSHYLAGKCQLRCFDPAYLVVWMRTIDRSLILQGWQEIAFVNPANLVFVYMLIRDHLETNENCKNIRSVDDLHSLVLTCLYISYSYMGNEISYPLKPFVSEKTDRDSFWAQCVKIIERHSRAMLKLNASSQYFLEVFLELKSHS